MNFIEPEFIDINSKRTLTQLLTSDIKQVNVYHAFQGAILGGHYHKETVEHFYITKGSFKVSIQKDNQVSQFPVNKGMAFTVFPYERHTLVVLSQSASMLTFLSKPYNKDNPDIWKN